MLSAGTLATTRGDSCHVQRQRMASGHAGASAAFEPWATVSLKQSIAFSWWAAVAHWPFSFWNIPDGSLMQAFWYASFSDRNALPLVFSGHFYSYLPWMNLIIAFKRHLIWILFLHFFSSIHFLPFIELITFYNFSLVYFFMLSLTTNIAINKIITKIFANFSGDNKDPTLSLTKKSRELGKMIATW